MDLMELEPPIIQHVQLDFPAVLLKLAEQISPGNNETLAMSIQRPDGIMLSMSLEKHTQPDGDRMLLDIIATEGETVVIQEIDKWVMNLGNIQSPVYLQTAKNKPKSTTKKSKKSAEQSASVVVEQIPDAGEPPTESVQNVMVENPNVTLGVAEATMDPAPVENEQSLPAQEVRNITDIIASGEIIMKDEENQCILDAGTILQGQTIGILEDGQLEGIEGTVQIQIDGQQLVNVEHAVAMQSDIHESQLPQDGDVQQLAMIEAAENVESGINPEGETSWWATDEAGTTYEVRTGEVSQDDVGENQRSQLEVGRVQLSGRETAEMMTSEASEINISKASEIPRIMADVTGLKCNICCKIYNSPKLLEGHYSRMHPECSYNEAEMESVIIKNAFLCFVCQQPFRRFDTMRKHLEAIHKLPTARRKISKQIACPICKSKHSSIHTLRCHLGYKHRDDPKYSEALEYLQNKIYAEKGTEKRNECILLQCPWCELQLTMKQFRHHIKTTHKNEEHVDSVLEEALKAVTEQRLAKYKTLAKECQICKKVFPYKSYYAHMRREHGPLKKTTPISNTTCAVCDKKFQSRWHLRQHMLTHEEVKRYRCEACGKQYRTPYSLKTHVRTVHMNIYRHRCQICTRGFHLRQRLLEHKCQPLKRRKLRPSHWPKVKVPENVAQERNENVKVEVTSTDGGVSVSIHEEQNEDDNEVSFRVVTKSEKPSTSEDVTIKTENSVLTEPWLEEMEDLDSGEFGCRKCGKSFAVKDRLKNHIIRIHGIKNKQGPEGGWMDHTDYLPSGIYRCKLCEKTFDKADNMRRHMRRVHLIVSGLKPIDNFPCEICNKSFIMASKLKTHMRIHAEREHQCPHCGKSFTSKYHMADHVRLVHKLTDKKTCDACGKQYKWVHNCQTGQSIVRQKTCDTCGREYKSGHTCRASSLITGKKSEADQEKDDDGGDDLGYEGRTLKIRITRNRQAKKPASDDFVNLDEVDDVDGDHQEEADDSDRDEDWKDDDDDEEEDDGQDDTMPRKRTPARTVQATNKTDKRPPPKEPSPSISRSRTSNSKVQSKTEIIEKTPVNRRSILKMPVKSTDKPSTKTPAKSTGNQDHKSPVAKKSITKRPAKSQEKTPLKKKAKVDDIDKCLPKISLNSEEKPTVDSSGNSPGTPSRSSRKRTQPAWMKVFTK